MTLWFVLLTGTTVPRIIVKERIYRDPCHWQDVLPKLTTFWIVCILPTMLVRWYTRKCDLSCKVQQTLAGICFCRMPSDGKTVKCCNPDCPCIEFHPSYLAIATPLPKRWYCPHCCRLPQFKRLRAAPKTKHGKISSEVHQALSLDSICVFQAVPQQSDKLLECHSGKCKSGSFFHLTCLGYKKIPNNSKTTWQCNNCKKIKTKSVDASSNASAFTSVEIAQETTACPSSSHDDQSETNELVSVNDSDIEEESDDVEVTTCESERHASQKSGSTRLPAN